MIGELVMLFMLMFLVGLALSVWAIVDILGHSDRAWAAIGQNKLVWVALVAAGTFFGGLIGVILAIVYLVSMRPRLQAAASSP